jgi:hypothetical protein
MVDFADNIIYATTPFNVSCALMAGAIFSSRVGMTGVYARNSNQIITHYCTDTSVKSVAATPAVTVSGNSGGNTLTANGRIAQYIAPFESITITGAGPAGADLTTVVVEIVDYTTFKVADNLSTTVTNTAIATLESTWVSVDGIKGSVTYDPPSLNSGQSDITTVTVPGAVLGDYVAVSFSRDITNVKMDPYVSAADTVTVVVTNMSSGVVNLGSGTLRAIITKQ